MEWANELFSERARSLKRSEIRELLKLTARPGIISFAGGLPHPDTINQEIMLKLTEHVVSEHDATALQYGPTEGRPELLSQLIAYHKQHDGMDVPLDNLLVTSAAQQAIALTAKIFLDSNDLVICGRPTYLGFLQAVRSYRGGFVGIPQNPDDGIEVEAIEDYLKKNGRGKVKYIYEVPDFQNPAGVTMSLEKRKRLIEIAREFKLIIVEDSPYRQLRYSGVEKPSMLSLDTEGDTVLTLFTFSKIFAPGLRLGWVAGPKPVIDKLVLVKQPADLCTSPFSQLLAAHYIEDGYLDQQIPFIIEFYRPKQQAMLEACERELGDIPGVRWTRPDGGMFLWLSLPEGFDSTELFIRTLERNVAFVVGGAFDCYGERNNSARLNFSYPNIEQIHEGMKILGESIKEMVSAKVSAG